MTNPFAEANYHLGRMLLEGSDDGKVKKDVKRAVECFEKAASAGLINAAYYLGIIYEKGAAPIRKDPKKAKRYLEHAAKNGHSKARERLAGQTNSKNQKEKAAKKDSREKDTEEKTEEKTNAHASSSRSKICGLCGKIAENVCGGCLAQYYCTLECQKSDWAQHKQACLASHHAHDH